MDNHYIRCLDEGHGPVSPVPHEEEGTTALMVNPAASQSVLLDAAEARLARIIDVTKPYLDLEIGDFDFTREGAVRLLITICAMAQEAHALAKGAQKTAGHGEAHAIRVSYLQTVEAGEALLGLLAKRKRSEAVTEAAEMLAANIGAARDDFLGTKEVQS